MEENQSGFVRFLLDKRYRVLWHILFWVTVYIDQFLSFLGFTPEYEEQLKLIIGLFIDMVVVYFNLYVLLPNFLLKERILQYILLTLLSLGVIMLYNHFAYPLTEEILNHPDYDPDYWLPELIIDILSNLFMFGMAIAIKLFKFTYTKDKRIQEITEEKLRTELGFLKNQVNPHFLFNTMNSFYIQAKKKDDKLPDAIMSLSDLLRYQIYETEKEYVSIENEMEYIKNYLDLENNRRDNLNINIKTTGISKHVKIAPLLLLPLVENAVKYSQRTDGNRAIINLELVIDDRISFTIINTKGKVSQIKSPDSDLHNKSYLRETMKCIIIDDEPLAREGMELLIPDAPFLELMKSFGSGEQALEYLAENEIDLIFLDIEMPGLNGLEFIKTLNQQPFIILTTAYPQYALDAFDLQVSDYLVKPIKGDRFLKAVYKVKEIFDLKSNEMYQVSELEEEHIFIRHERKYVKLFYKDMLYINGLKDYVMIHTKEGKFITAMNLKTILSKLPDSIFIRTSKSYAININRVESVDVDFIYLGDKIEVPLGNAYKEEFKKRVIADRLVDRKKS